MFEIELSWHLTVCKQKSCTYAELNYLKELFICIKMDSALNNLQWLICHKTKPNIFFTLWSNQIWGSPHSVVVNMLNCDIVSENHLQSHYYVHFLEKPQWFIYHINKETKPTKCHSYSGSLTTVTNKPNAGGVLMV